MSISGNGLMFGTPTTTVYSPGLTWTSYNGYFNDNVNFFSTAATRSIGGVYTGTVSNLTNVGTATNNVWGVNANDTYSIQWLGYFLAPSTGTYTWATNSDDASYLWIGPNAVTGFTTANATVINGSPHGMRTITGTASLTAGVYYPIRIQFGEQGGGDDMQVYFQLPGSGTAIYNGVGYYFNTVTTITSTVLVKITFDYLVSGQSSSGTSSGTSTGAQLYLSVKSAASVPSTDNTNTTTLTNTNVTIVTDTTRGKVLYFNGSAFFNTNYSLPILHTRLFWVKFTATNVNNNILSSNSRPFWGSGSVYMNFNMNYGGGGGTYTDTNSFTTGVWYFYALTYDGTTAVLYRNGNVNFTAVTGSTATPDTMQIGAYQSGNNLSGYLDNIRCYNTTLTQTQIQAIYNYELANPNEFYYENSAIITTGLVVHLDAGNSSSYPGSGTVWYDICGLGNNATLPSNLVSTYNTTNRGNFVFNGSNSASSSNSTGFNITTTNAISVECWLKVNSIPTSNYQFFWTAPGSGGCDYRYGISISPTQYYWDSGQHSDRNTVTVSTSLMSWAQLVYTTGIQNGTEYTNIYLNGVNVVNNYNEGITNFNSIITNWYIGCGEQSNLYPFIGSMSILRVYNKALSSTEINNNFTVQRGLFGI